MAALLRSNKARDVCSRAVTIANEASVALLPDAQSDRSSNSVALPCSARRWAIAAPTIPAPITAIWGEGVTPRVIERWGDGVIGSTRSRLQSPHHHERSESSP